MTTAEHHTDTGEGNDSAAVLLRRIRAVEAHALDDGALQPIATRSRVLERDGMQALVRILEHAERKALAQKRQDSGGKSVDPFLPYEEALFVQTAGPAHVVLLNKFPVLAHHVLIITRAFEPQDSALTEADFAALHGLMREAGGLGFYNSGEVAGASQRHKHLQWVPTPLDPACTAPVPIDALVSDERLSTGHIPALEFRHTAHPLPAPVWQGHEGARYMWEAYRQALRRNGLGSRDPLPPYNLLVTHRWMMVVPRRRERWNTVSINALGFAGAFLVRNEDEFRQLATTGPLAVLRAVATGKRPRDP